MSVIDILLILSSFVTTGLSLSVLIYSPRRKSDFFFSLAALAATIWIIAMFFYRTTDDPVFFEFFARLLYFAGISIAVGYYIFASNFLIEKKLSYLLHLFIYAVIMLSISFPRDAFISAFHFSSRTLAFGINYLPYSIILAGYFLFAFFRLFSTNRQLKTAEEKKQLKFVFWGTGISIIIGIIFDIIVPYFGSFRLYWLGPVMLTVMVVSVSYAIFKHGLFNIRLVSVELFSAALLIISFIQFIGSGTVDEYVFNGLLFLGVAIFGILIVRGVLQEIRHREEIERLAESLRRANAELKKLDQLKSEFLSLASHQLRAPLTVVKGYISMIQEGDYGEIPEKLREALRRVYFSNERLINLVGDFLNISRIESGRLHYVFEPSIVADLIRSVVGEFKDFAKDRGLELSCQEPKEALPLARIDRDKFRQVIVNLIDNAIKYTRRGSIKLEMGLEENSILISVQDTGIGLAPEELDFIFKRFSRGEGATKVYTEGMGLGLYLAKRIVQDHGGEIWAESKGKNRGSTFYIKIPALTAEVKRAEQFKEFVEKI